MDGNGADHETEHVHDFVQRSEPADAVAPDPVQKRNYLGWFVLAILFAFLILNGIMGSFTRQADNGSHFQEEIALRQIVRQKQLLASLRKVAPIPSQSLDDAFREIDEKLAPDAMKDRGAARLLVASKAEQGKKASAQLLSFLTRSPEEKDRAFARLYATDKLSRGAAERLLPELQGDAFEMELARVHAREKAGISPSGREAIAPAWKAAAMLIVGVLGFGVLALGVCVWIAYFAMRSSGKLTPLGIPLQKIDMADADRLAMRACQIIGSYFCLSVAGRFILLAAPQLPESTAGLVSSVGILLVVLTLQKVPIEGKLITLDSIGVNRKDFGRNVLWGVAGFAAELPVTILMGLIGQFIFKFLPPATHPASTTLQNSPDMIVVVSVLIFGAVIAPFWEEVMFRGLLFPAVTRISRRNILVGAVVTSFAFAAIHPQGMSLWLALGTVAGMSCALSYHTRSLVPSITMHALHNLSLLSLTLILF